MKHWRNTSRAGHSTDTEIPGSRVLPMPNRPDTSPATERDALIVVLGMHRSGTSTLTRAMHVLGAEFGTRLLPPVRGDNDKGFFEDLDVNTLNIELMHAMGVDWHTMAPIALEQIKPQRMAQFQRDALRLLREKCVDRHVLALKDPRISRLLPFWQPLFEQLERRVVYAIAVRNPISVSDSLAARDQLPREKSYLLWLAHTVPALDMTRGRQRTIISYDRLMDAPRPELERIAREVGLPVMSSRLDEFEREFLDGTLRHSRHEATDVQALDSAPQQLKNLYFALEQGFVTSGAESDHLESALDSAQAYLNDIAPILRCEWRVEQSLIRINEQYMQVTREYASVLRSGSWRITAPLRAIMRGLRASKNALMAS
jgi:hypothetical protein